MTFESTFVVVVVVVGMSLVADQHQWRVYINTDIYKNNKEEEEEEEEKEEEDEMQRNKIDEGVVFR